MITKSYLCGVSEGNEIETDLIVIGGSNAGIAAAIAAAKKGIDVIVLEKYG